jgi:hypothetical protein
VLSFQEANACCGSKVIEFLNSSSDSRSVWFPGVVLMLLQVTASKLQAMSTSRKDRPVAAAFMVTIIR